MSAPISVEQLQAIWDKVQSEFSVYEKTYLVPITHLRSKTNVDILDDLDDYAYFKTHDKYMWNKKISTEERRKPSEFKISHNLWFLDDKPVFYKEKHITPDDISDLPEFCINSYCPLFRDLDNEGQKYYYMNDDSYENYLRKKEGKKSKIDEIIDEAMKLIDEDTELQEKIDELVDKERKALNSLS